MEWDIAGRRVVVTGANSGIGKATAEELTRRGADVMITARDADRGEAAVADIRRATGRTVGLGSLDLADLASVRDFAAGYRREHDRLDVLVNNAGVMSGSRRFTPDGFEWTFGVNHLGPFLLTALLDDLLVSGAPSRIVNVSSEVHRNVEESPDIDDVTSARGRYSASRAYAVSKWANIVFTAELNRRRGESGVTSAALHPGVVATSFGKGAEGSRWIGVLMTVLRPVLRTPVDGAATSVHLATAPVDVVGRAVYWSDSEPREPLPSTLDEAVGRRLWTASERLVGLDG